MSTKEETAIVPDVEEEDTAQELEDMDVEDEEETPNPSVGTNFHQYTPHKVVRVRDPSLEGAPLIPFKRGGAYHSKTIIGAFRKAVGKIFDLNNFECGKTIWLTMNWKVPYDTDQMDDSGKPIQASRNEHEQYFFTRMPAAKPKKLYLYDEEMMVIRDEWQSETTIVDETSSLIKIFRDNENKIHQFTKQELKGTVDVLNPITKVMEKRGPVHAMESIGLLYTRPSANLTIERRDGVWTRTENDQTMTIVPQESPKHKGKHHVVDFKWQSVEVVLDDDAIEIKRIEDAEREYALNPPAKAVRRNRKEESAKAKPRRKRILVAEEIKEQMDVEKNKKLSEEETSKKSCEEETNVEA